MENLVSRGGLAKWMRGGFWDTKMRWGCLSLAGGLLFAGNCSAQVTAQNGANVSLDPTTTTVTSQNSGTAVPVVTTVNYGWALNAMANGSLTLSNPPTASYPSPGTVFFETTGISNVPDQINSPINAGALTGNLSGSISATNLTASARGPGAGVAGSMGSVGYVTDDPLPNSGAGFTNITFTGTNGGAVTVTLDATSTLSTAGSGLFDSGPTSSTTVVQPVLTGLNAYSVGGAGTGGAYYTGIDADPHPYYGDGGMGGEVKIIGEAGSEINLSQVGDLYGPVGIAAVSQGGAAGSLLDLGRGNAYYGQGGFGGVVGVEYAGSVTSTAQTAIGILAASIGGVGSQTDVATTNVGGGVSGDGGLVEVEMLSGSSISLAGGIGIMAVSAAGNWNLSGATLEEIPSGSMVNVTIDSNSSISTGSLMETPGKRFSLGVLAISSGTSTILNPFAEGDSYLAGNGVSQQVTIMNSGVVQTAGDLSIGLAAISNGGGSMVVSVDAGLNYLGNSGSVIQALASGASITNEGGIWTLGSSASGIVAISAGGGGLMANDTAFAGSVGNATAGSAIGSNAMDGSVGANGENVTVNNSGSVTTGNGSNGGIASMGIIAQSIGGSGGSGGGNQSFFNVGDMGGGGGAGGGVTVTLSGASAIRTLDKNSIGVLAQSIGGGGGNGANVYGGFVATGGAGGNGGDGAPVQVQLQAGTIVTQGSYSQGVLAQSIGGGGGNGGVADTAGAFFSEAIGGSGGNGGQGGGVNVTQSQGAQINTRGNVSGGMVVQSIGGGGGAGGAANSFAAGADFAVALAVGGRGGQGGSGTRAQGFNEGAITTGEAPGTLINGPLLATSGYFNGTLSDGTVIQYGAILTGTVTNGVLVATLADGTIIDGNIASGTLYGILQNSTSDLVNSIYNADTGTFAVSADGPHINGADSIGLMVQSIGGGGGTGGAATAKSLSLPIPTPDGSGVKLPSISIAASIGGNGGGGGDGGLVEAGNTGRIITYGDGSLGVLAQSIGGGGGNATDSTATAMAVETKGDNYKLAVSIVGGGGDAGNGGGVLVGNSTVAGVDGSGFISTSGQNAAGMIAQSIGGGGGNGGTGNASTSSPNLYPAGNAYGVSLKLGGSGGSGGGGSQVEVGNLRGAIINTVGSGSPGILAQSIGLGGGTAFGGSSSGSGDNFDMNVSLGANGGIGGAGGGVLVKNEGAISTQGGDASGILAQSIGGGGGVAGSSDASATIDTRSQLEDQLNQPSDSYTANIAVGGEGGGGGDGGSVTISNLAGSVSGTITDFSSLIVIPGISTQGIRAHGILAQSIGGGGGSGGAATSSSNSVWLGTVPSGGQKAGTYSADVSLGGNGGTGGSANAVTISNSGVIGTTGYGSTGILAQSIGGGGGIGAEGTVDSTTTIGLGKSVSGGGGSGNSGGAVNVTHAQNAWVITAGDDAPGILAQSISGGGGLGSAGSKGFTVQGANAAPGINFTLNLGGIEGDGGTSGPVTVTNSGTIVTNGNYSHGLVAQSIGGGGGKASSYSTDTVTATIGITLGGQSGSSGGAGEVVVNPNGGTVTIQTAGYSAFGLVAQSIGGGGGIATDGSDRSAFATGSIQVGNEGSGGAQQVVVGVGSSSFFNIQTLGFGAHALVAQSIGGGGGIAVTGSPENSGGENPSQPVRVSVGGTQGGVGAGNNVMIDGTLLIGTQGANAYGVLAQSIGGGGGLAVAQNAGTVGSDTFTGNNSANSNNTGAPIDILMGTASVLTTTGEGAHGLVAQSIGGGGGIANYNSGGFLVNINSPYEFSGQGNGGSVSITTNGTIMTTGANAYGILAQSIGGGGGLLSSAGTLWAGTTGPQGPASGSGGGINITQNGTLIASGENSIAIFAQSQGPDSSAVSQIDINGTVQGGSGAQGYGVFLDSSTNGLDEMTIYPGASVSALSGYGITYNNTGGGILLAYNLGSLYGSVTASNNSISFNNAGFYSPGSSAPVATSPVSLFAAPVAPRPVNMAANFRQTSTGTLFLNLDSAATYDYLYVGGDAQFDGRLMLNVRGNLTADMLKVYTDMLQVDGELSGRFAELLSSLPSLQVTAQGTDVTLSQGSFATLPGMDYTPNELAVANHIDTYTPTRMSGDFADLVLALDQVSFSPAALRDAFAQLSPEKFGTFASSTLFNNAVFSTQQMNNYLRGLRSANGTFTRGGGIDSSGLTLLDSDLDGGLASIRGRLLAWAPGARGNTMSDVADPLSSSVVPVRVGMDPVRPWSIFVQGSAILAQTFSDASQPHAESTTGAMQVGADYRFTDHFLGGILFGYGHTDSTVDSLGSKGTVDSFAPGVYAAYADGGWYGNALFSYGFNDFTMDRQVSFGPLTGRAQASPGGDQQTASLDGGYDFHAGNWTFGPSAGVLFTHMTVDAYRESGIPPAALTVNEQQADSFRSRLGGRVGWRTQVDHIVFRPHLDLSWQHEFMDQSRGITSQFNSLGTGSFVVQTQNPSRESALIDVGLDTDFNGRATLFINWSAQAGQSNYFGQSVQGGVRVSF